MLNSWTSVRSVLLAVAIGGLCQVAIATADDGLPAEGASDSPTQAPTDPPGEGPFLVEWADPPSDTGWSFDYRTRWLFNSRTSYEFGQIPSIPPLYAPLSRLDWSLNSMWHGFQIGRRGTNWGLQFEWLAPMESTIHGNLDDYDWLDSAMPDHLSSLSSSALRWNEGQMLDLGGELRLGDNLLGIPVEVWPMAGFRFQRFAMTGHDGIQVIGDDPSVPSPGPGPTCSRPTLPYLALAARRQPRRFSRGEDLSEKTGKATLNDQPCRLFFSHGLAFSGVSSLGRVKRLFQEPVPSPRKPWLPVGFGTGSRVSVKTSPVPPTAMISSSGCWPGEALLIQRREVS